MLTSFGGSFLTLTPAHRSLPSHLITVHITHLVPALLSPSLLAELFHGTQKGPARALELVIPGMNLHCTFYPFARAAINTD